MLIAFFFLCQLSQTHDLFCYCHKIDKLRSCYWTSEKLSLVSTPPWRTFRSFVQPPAFQKYNVASSSEKPLLLHFIAGFRSFVGFLDETLAHFHSMVPEAYWLTLWGGIIIGLVYKVCLFSKSFSHLLLSIPPWARLKSCPRMSGTRL